MRPRVALAQSLKPLLRQLPHPAVMIHCTRQPHIHPQTLRPQDCRPGPSFFVVPKFTYEAEFELHQKNTEFETNGTYFNPGPKLKGVILDGLAQEMMKYPKDYQCEEVTAALTRAHPSLG